MVKHQHKGRATAGEGIRLLQHLQVIALPLRAEREAAMLCMALLGLPVISAWTRL